MNKYILSFDPGGTTGWAMGVYTDNQPLTFIGGGQIPDGLAGFNLWMAGRTSIFRRGDVAVVAESFVLDGRTKFPNITPLRIEGALEAWLYPIQPIYQRNTAKGYVSDQRLRDYDLWIPGQRHQMDARIHAMACMYLMGHVPTLNAYGWGE